MDHISPTFEKLATKPTSFPNGNLPDVYGATHQTPAYAFASRINIELRATVRGIFKAAAIIDEAKKTLDANDCIKLAELVELSPPTLSKYQSIHSQQLRFDDHIEKLPSSWTVLYELSRLTDGQFQKLVMLGKLRRDLTARDLASFLSEVSQAMSSESSSAQDSVERKQDEPIKDALRTIAVVRTPAGLPDNAVEAIKSLVAQSLRDQPAHIDFPVSKTAAQQRRLVSALEKLQFELMEMMCESDIYRESLNESEYEAFENAAFQHHHWDQKGTYPYPSSDPRSIEHPDHRFCIKGELASSKLFFKHLRSQNLITPYSPVSDFGSADEARCLKLGIDFCEAKTPKAKSLSKKELLRIAEEDPANSGTAKRVLLMILGEHA